MQELKSMGCILVILFMDCIMYTVFYCVNILLCGCAIICMCAVIVFVM